MSKKIDRIIPFIYLLLCIVIAFLRIPFWDEARAWLIAQNCNLFQFLDMMKLECHLFIWYLVIAPFAKLNLFYPYSIYIINALFAFFAIFVLWKKAPFSGAFFGLTLAFLFDRSFGHFICSAFYIRM